MRRLVTDNVYASLSVIGIDGTRQTVEEIDGSLICIIIIILTCRTITTRARGPRVSLDLISTIESTSINRTHTEERVRKTTANLARWRGGFIVVSECVAGLGRRVGCHCTGGCRRRGRSERREHAGRWPSNLSSDVTARCLSATVTTSSRSSCFN